MGDQVGSIMTWYPTESHYPETEPISPCSILVILNDKYKFLSYWFDSTRNWTAHLPQARPVLYWLGFCTQLEGRLVVEIVYIGWYSLYSRCQYQKLSTALWGIRLPASQRHFVSFLVVGYWLVFHENWMSGLLTFHVGGHGFDHCWVKLTTYQIRHSTVPRTGLLKNPLEKVSASWAIDRSTWIYNLMS